MPAAQVASAGYFKKEPGKLRVDAVLIPLQCLLFELVSLKLENITQPLSPLNLMFSSHARDSFLRLPEIIRKNLDGLCVVRVIMR